MQRAEAPFLSRTSALELHRLQPPSAVLGRSASAGLYKGRAPQGVAALRLYHQKRATAHGADGCGEAFRYFAPIKRHKMAVPASTIESLARGGTSITRCHSQRHRAHERALCPSRQPPQPLESLRSSKGGNPTTCNGVYRSGKGCSRASPKPSAACLSRCKCCRGMQLKQAYPRPRSPKQSMDNSLRIPLTAEPTSPNPVLLNAF